MAALASPDHEQLNVYGEGEPYAQVAARHRAHRELTGVQREILTAIRASGPMRAVEAGVLIHRARNIALNRRCHGGAKGHGPTKLACCHYAATDGYEAMKRLFKRGLVTQQEDKRWKLA